MALRCVLRLNVMPSNCVASHIKRVLNGQRPIQMVNLRELHCDRGDRLHLHCSSSKPSLIEAAARLTPMRYASGERAEAEQITFDYYKGLPRLTIPLPSRKERCRFTLKLVSNTVGDLCEMVKAEDRGIDRVVISSKDGVRIASSNSIELLLEEEEFHITINDTCHKINVPSTIRESFNKDDLQKLSDVRMTVSQLYDTLNVRDYQIHREQELLSEQEKLRLTLEPYEELRNKLENKAMFLAEKIPWTLLFVYSVQNGVLIRFTWWEYSWDIMEPVTYFVTAGNITIGLAYYCLFKQDFILRDVTDRRRLVVLHKKALKYGFDMNVYNELKRQQARVRAELIRLDPVKYSPVLSRPPSLPARLGYASSSDSSSQSETALKSYIEILLDAFKKQK